MIVQNVRYGGIDVFNSTYFSTSQKTFHTNKPMTKQANENLKTTGYCQHYQAGFEIFMETPERQPDIKYGQIDKYERNHISV